MDKKAAPLSLGFRVLFWSMSTAFVVFMCYAVYVLVDVFRSIRTQPTYSHVCAPLAFIRKVDYYNDRTFVVCGSSTTEPVLKEYPRQ